VNTCPHCGMKMENSKYANEYDCGSFFDRKNKWYRTNVCEIREPLWKELQSTKARIDALVKIGDQIIENGSVSERLANEWNKAKKQ